MPDTASLQQSRSRIHSWHLPVLLLLIYGLGLTCAHYWDGVLFSLTAEHVHTGSYSWRALFHPNHLLYTAAGYLAYSAAQPLFHVRAITCFALLNAACGAAAVAIVYRRARIITQSALLASASAVLFAFGATWWKFSTDADAYIPAVLLVLLAMEAALSGHPMRAGAIHAAAMLFHQLSVFAAIPIAAALYSRNRRSPAIYLALATGITLCTYIAAFHLVDPGIPFLRWLVSFSSHTKTSATLSQFWSAYPASYSKLFIGGRFSLIREFFGWQMAIGFAVCLISLVLTGLAFRAGSTPSVHPDPRLTRILWLWIAPYALFLAWFEPGNAFYKLFLWPPLVWLIAIAASRRAHAFRTLTLALAGWNFAAFIYPHVQANSDPVYAFALRINQQLPPDATVYYRSFSPDDWYLAYFAPKRNWRPLPQAAPPPPACFETTALGSMSLPRPVKQSWILDDGRHYVRLACY